MNCLFWNVRGITTRGKNPCIVDTLNITNASIVSFQEPKKEELSASFLKSIGGSKNFQWHHLPAVGTTGGVLVGVDVDIFEILQWSSLNFSVSCNLKVKTSGVYIRVVVVYGSPYDEGKR